MQTQKTNNAFESASLDREILNAFSNNWFIPQCSWQIPDVKQLQEKGEEEQKAVISKSIIGLRQSTEKYDNAMRSYESGVDMLVRAHLDAWDLQFGYANESQAIAINSKKEEAMRNYNDMQSTIAELNKSQGGRAAATVCLISNEKDKKKGTNFLAIMGLLKKIEASVNHGMIKCNLLKFSISLCCELGRAKYTAVIAHLAKELGAIYDKVKPGLERIPAGVIGSESVKDVIAAKISALPENEDEKIVLIHRFEELAGVFCEVNTKVCTQLAKIAVPIEKEFNMIEIKPSHKEEDGRLL